MSRPSYISDDNSNCISPSPFLSVHFHTALREMMLQMEKEKKKYMNKTGEYFSFSNVTLSRFCACVYIMSAKEGVVRHILLARLTRFYEPILPVV